MNLKRGNAGGYGNDIATKISLIIKVCFVIHKE